MNKFRTLLTVIFLGCVLAMSGCSHLSVRHLARNPWAVKPGQNLQMKFWSFSYEAVPYRDSFGIRGVAHPNRDKLPDWASWIEELWLAAYLSDESGEVVAKDLLVSLPNTLSPEAGVPFEFILEPDELADAGPLFLTFGYRMVLTPGKPEAAQGSETGDAKKIFFANEGALTRF